MPIRMTPVSLVYLLVKIQKLCILTKTYYNDFNQILFDLLGCISGDCSWNICIMPHGIDRLVASAAVNQPGLEYH